MNSKLILAGISNTMDLVYKLSQKYKHDLRHIKNVIFKPYDEDKILNIVYQRLGEEIIFDNNALTYAVKKILNLRGGDIR